MHLLEGQHLAHQQLTAKQSAESTVSQAIPQ